MMTEKQGKEFKELLKDYLKTIALFHDSNIEMKVVTNATIKDWINQNFISRDEMDENTSDGYHTFKELYEFRLLYNAAWFNELASKLVVYKSKKHDNGELCFGGGWFIVVAELPTGQISNHYELKDWDLFKVDELLQAQSFDGHTPKDVADRIRKYLESNLLPEEKYDTR